MDGDKNHLKDKQKYVNLEKFKKAKSVIDAMEDERTQHQN